MVLYTACSVTSFEWHIPGGEYKNFFLECMILILFASIRTHLLLSYRLKRTIQQSPLILQNIPINGAVLMVADEILKSRSFSLNHGGILDTRDIVGIKKGG